MTDTSRNEPVSKRDIHYYRRRQRNRVFAALTAFFTEESERDGITKRRIAERLGKDPAQITRWLSEPSNLTLDTISDLLMALHAEMDYRVTCFEEQPKSNIMHDMVARALRIEQPKRDEVKDIGKAPQVMSGTAANTLIITSTAKRWPTDANPNAEVLIDA